MQHMKANTDQAQVGQAHAATKTNYDFIEGY